MSKFRLNKRENRLIGQAMHTYNMLEDGDRVLVKLRGACATCNVSQVTLKHYVETKIRDLVAPELAVEEVV